MPRSRWKAEEPPVEELIALVERNAALFDPGDERYTDNNLKTDLWNTIARQMRMDGLLAATAGALSAAASSPLESRPPPNLRSLSTKPRPPLRRVSSAPRPSAGRVNSKRSDPPKQRQAPRSASPNPRSTPRSAPRKLPTATHSLPSTPPRAGSPKRAQKRSNTDNNQNGKKSIGRRAAARLVPPPEETPPDRSKPDASGPESLANLQLLDGLSQIGLPMDAASFLAAAKSDAASVLGPPGATGKSNSSSPPLEDLPPTDEYYNASLLGRERLGPALAKELQKHALARRRVPPPPPGVPDPLPPPPELRPSTPQPSRRMDWILYNNEQENPSLWLMHDLMKQAIYQAQERAKALQAVIDKYMRSLFFRMGFVFRKLEEQEKELHMMFTHMRRTWYSRGIRWPWFYHIDYYNICLQRNVDISYMVDRIIEVFNKFYKAREEHIISSFSKSREKKKG